MKSENDKRNSSFLGFLNGYSRGNLKKYMEISPVLSDSINFLRNDIDQVIASLDANNPSHSGLITVLKRSYASLQNEDVLMALYDFTKHIELTVPFYRVELSSFDDELTKKVKPKFDKMLVDYVEIVKNINNIKLLSMASNIVKKLPRTENLLPEDD